VTLDVWRDGKQIQKQVKLRERPLNTQGGEEEVSPGGKPEGSSGIEWLGIQYQDISSALRNGHGLPSDVNGILVTNVTPTSPLYEQFVRPGTVITEINGQAIKGTADFERIVKSAKPGSYLRFYSLQPDPRGRTPQSFFAVVQVPSGK
jgi:serine protease Do